MHSGKKLISNLEIFELILNEQLILGYLLFKFSSYPHFTGYPEKVKLNIIGFWNVYELNLVLN